MRPHRHYVAGWGAKESSGAQRVSIDGGQAVLLPRPTMVTIAAARLARAWRVTQREAQYGSPVISG